MNEADLRELRNEILMHSFTDSDIRANVEKMNQAQLENLRTFIENNPTTIINNEIASIVTAEAKTPENTPRLYAMPSNIYEAIKTGILQDFEKMQTLTNSGAILDTQQEYEVRELSDKFTSIKRQDINYLEEWINDEDYLAFKADKQIDYLDFETGEVHTLPGIRSLEKIDNPEFLEQYKNAYASAEVRSESSPQSRYLHEMVAFELGISTTELSELDTAYYFRHGENVLSSAEFQDKYLKPEKEIHREVMEIMNAETNYTGKDYLEAYRNALNEAYQEDAKVLKALDGNHLDNDGKQINGESASRYWAQTDTGIYSEYPAIEHLGIAPPDWVLEEYVHNGFIDEEQNAFTEIFRLVEMQSFTEGESITLYQFLKMSGGEIDALLEKTPITEEELASARDYGANEGKSVASHENQELQDVIMFSLYEQKNGSLNFIVQDRTSESVNFAHDYGENPNEILSAIQAVQNGDNAKGWEGHDEALAAKFTNKDDVGVLVANNNGINPSAMQEKAQEVFSLTLDDFLAFEKYTKSPPEEVDFEKLQELSQKFAGITHDDYYKIADELTEQEMGISWDEYFEYAKHMESPEMEKHKAQSIEEQFAKELYNPFEKFDSEHVNFLVAETNEGNLNLFVTEIESASPNAKIIFAHDYSTHENPGDDLQRDIEWLLYPTDTSGLINIHDAALAEKYEEIHSENSWMIADSTEGMWLNHFGEAAQKAFDISPNDYPDIGNNSISWTEYFTRVAETEQNNVKEEERGELPMNTSQNQEMERELLERAEKLRNGETMVYGFAEQYSESEGKKEDSMGSILNAAVNANLSDEQIEKIAQKNLPQDFWIEPGELDSNVFNNFAYGIEHDIIKEVTGFDIHAPHSSEINIQNPVQEMFAVLQENDLHEISNIMKEILAQNMALQNELKQEVEMVTALKVTCDKMSESMEEMGYAVNHPIRTTVNGIMEKIEDSGNSIKDKIDELKNNIVECCKSIVEYVKDTATLASNELIQYVNRDFKALQENAENGVALYDDKIGKIELLGQEVRNAVTAIGNIGRGNKEEEYAEAATEAGAIVNALNAKNNVMKTLNESTAIGCEKVIQAFDSYNEKAIAIQEKREAITEAKAEYKAAIKEAKELPTRAERKEAVKKAKEEFLDKKNEARDNAKITDKSAKNGDDGR